MPNARQWLGGVAKSLEGAMFEGYLPQLQYNEEQRLRKARALADMMDRGRYDPFAEEKFRETGRHNLAMEGIARDRLNTSDGYGRGIGSPEALLTQMLVGELYGGKAAPEGGYDRIYETIGKLEGLKDHTKAKEQIPPDLMEDLIGEVGKAERQYSTEYRDWKRQPYVMSPGKDAAGELTFDIKALEPPEEVDPYAIFEALEMPRARRYNLNPDSLMALVQEIYPNATPPPIKMEPGWSVKRPPQAAPQPDRKEWDVAVTKAMELAGPDWDTATEAEREELVEAVLKGEL
jgi:hypothetical protein